MSWNCVKGGDTISEEGTAFIAVICLPSRSLDTLLKCGNMIER